MHARLTRGVLQVRARIQWVAEQEGKLCVREHAASLAREHASLQAKQQQLAAALAASQRANASSRAEVQAAASHTAAQLTAAGVRREPGPRCVWWCCCEASELRPCLHLRSCFPAQERLAAVKRQAFELGRQSSINDIRCESALCCASVCDAT